MQRRYVSFLAAAMVAGCGGSGSTSTNVVPVARVVITGSSGTLQAGQSVQLFASALDAAGGQVVSAGTATWSSSAVSIATVSSSGRATGVAEGQATISATIGGVTGTMKLTVAPLTPADRAWASAATERQASSASLRR